MNELEMAYADPRFRAVLGVIRDAEGTSKYADAYRVAGGGKHTLQSLDSPNFVMWGFKDKTGKGNQSSATGAYQFLRGTWDGLQKKYGFKDFSPRSQDLGALALMKDAGAFPYIQRGDYAGAFNAIRKIWASLPGAGYNQQERSHDFLAKSLQKHLGQPVSMHQVTQPQMTNNTPLTGVHVGDISPPQNDPYASLFNVDINNTPEDIAYNQPIEIQSGRKQTQPTDFFMVE